MDLLDHYLAGSTERYYHKQVDFWWNQHAILDYVMGRSLETFKRRLRLAVNETLCAKEGRKETVRRAFSVPRRVSDAKGGADSLVLDNIVHHASPDLMNVMRAKYDPTRNDYLRHTEELTHFATSTEIGSGSIGHEIVATHVEALPHRQDTRKRFECRNTGHI